MRRIADTRVGMFVFNDMRLDSRVRREASTLASAGYSVTVHAVMSEATRHVAREEVDGFTIVRIPVFMRPTPDVPTEGQPPPGPQSPLRRIVTGAFVATRPLLGGTLHFTANWQLRWSAWARRVSAAVQPSTIWHAHDFNTLGLAVACQRRYGGRLVYDSHELFTESGATANLPGGMRYVLRRLEGEWARRADATLTVNDSIAAVMRDQMGVEPVVVRNCARPPGDQPSPLRERIGATGDPVVLYHGSLAVGRGLEQLIAAAEQPEMSRRRLVIMGFGPLRPRIVALAEASAARDRIHLLPPVAPEQVTTWVGGADVAAMPIEPDTLNHRLSSPNKLFEAIAAGVPVVGPDFVEFRRVVEDPRRGPLGRLHPDHQPASIARAIDDVLSLPVDELQAMRDRCAAAAAERWNWIAEGRRLVATYGELSALGAPRRRAAHADRAGERATRGS